jgi:mRNA-degrading endonuclease RelE of RelBE toxin-antitoxin system
MTSKIDKELAKLSAKERAVVKAVLTQLKKSDEQGLQIAKLKGHQDIFRVRKGRLRIIYQQGEKAIHILAIERRSKATHHDF